MSSNTSLPREPTALCFLKYCSHTQRIVHTHRLLQIPLLSTILLSSSSWWPPRNTENEESPDPQKTKENNHSNDQACIRVTHTLHHTWCYCFHTTASEVLCSSSSVLDKVSSQLQTFGTLGHLQHPSSPIRVFWRNLYRQGGICGPAGSWHSIDHSQGTMVLKGILIHNNWENK